MVRICPLASQGRPEGRPLRGSRRPTWRSAPTSCAPADLKVGPYVVRAGRP